MPAAGRGHRPVGFGRQLLPGPVAQLGEHVPAVGDTAELGPVGGQLAVGVGVDDDQPGRAGSDADVVRRPRPGAGDAGRVGGGPRFPPGVPVPASRVGAVAAVGPVAGHGGPLVAGRSGTTAMPRSAYQTAVSRSEATAGAWRPIPAPLAGGGPA